MQAIPVQGPLPAADWLQDAAVKALRRLLPVLALRPLQARLSSRAWRLLNALYVDTAC